MLNFKGQWNLVPHWNLLFQFSFPLHYLKFSKYPSFPNSLLTHRLRQQCKQCHHFRISQYLHKQLCIHFFWHSHRPAVLCLTVNIRIEMFLYIPMPCLI